MIDVTEELSARQRTIALSALWMWRSQLGRVGSGQSVPGLATAESIEEIDEIARLLGGNPKSYCFGVETLCA
jgi:hypothetical protein